VTPRNSPGHREGLLQSFVGEAYDTPQKIAHVRSEKCRMAEEISQDHAEERGASPQPATPVRRKTPSPIRAATKNFRSVKGFPRLARKKSRTVEDEGGTDRSLLRWSWPSVAVLGVRKRTGQK